MNFQHQPSSNPFDNEPNYIYQNQPNLSYQNQQQYINNPSTSAISIHNNNIKAEDISTQSPLSLDYEDSEINENNVEKFLNLGNQDFIYFNNFQLNNLSSPHNNNQAYLSQQDDYYQKFGPNSEVNQNRTNNININSSNFQINTHPSFNSYNQIDFAFNNNNNNFGNKCGQSEISCQLFEGSENINQEKQVSILEQQQSLIDMQVEEQLKNSNCHNVEEIKNQVKLLLKQAKGEINKAQINKLIEKSKRIIKREIAKSRQKKGAIQIPPKNKQLSECNEILSSKSQKKGSCNQVQKQPQYIQELEQTNYNEDNLHSSFSSSENAIMSYDGIYNTSNNQNFVLINDNNGVKSDDNQSTSESNNLNIKKDIPQKAQKKIQQMIRNRISAQNSRDRKKAYIQKLESDNEKLVEQNMLLMNKIQQLQATNNQMQMKMEQHRQMIVNNGYNSYNITEVEKPQRQYTNSYNRNFYKLGLALLSIVSIICLININKDNQFLENNNNKNRMLLAQSSSQGINMETQKPLLQIEDNSQNQPSQYYTNFVIDKDNSTLSKQDLQLLLKHIEHYRANLIQKLKSMNVKQEEDSSSTMLAPIYQQKNEMVLIQDNKQLAPLNLNSQQEISTMYCPSIYLHSQASQKLQNTEWIQLLVPKHKINNLFIQEEDIGKKASRSFFRSTNQIKQIDVIQSNGSESKNLMMVELMCKVHQYRELQ